MGYEVHIENGEPRELFSIRTYVTNPDKRRARFSLGVKVFLLIFLIRQRGIEDGKYRSDSATACHAPKALIFGKRTATFLLQT
jgi:hypothetical protein